MRRFGVAIFLGAFLLFLVQPLVSKIILPWYGGSASLWTTCMLFFQTALVVGYFYANRLAALCGQRQQALIHLGVTGLAVAAALVLFPPGATWRPIAGAPAPYWQILLTLGVTVGLPFCLLSATSPLLQSWYSQAGGETPYRLYSLSNLGSLLGLLAYPFAIEPLIASDQQGRLWIGLFLAFAVTSAICALRILRQPTEGSSAPAEEAMGDAPPPGQGLIALCPPAKEAVAATDEPPPRKGLIAYWVILSTFGSILLLAVTNQLCQDIAVVPFLWVLPLLLYLATFIITFGQESLYRRPWVITGLLISIGLSCWVINTVKERSLWIQIAVLSAALFFGCLLFHGELVRSKPAARHLTQFYLLVSVGGALGGLFVCLVAPFIFLGFWELHLVLVGSIAVVMLALWRDRPAATDAGPKRRLRLKLGLLSVALVGTAGVLGWEIYDDLHENVATYRDFYGVVHVKDSTWRPGQLYYLFYGRTMHGNQIKEKPFNEEPTLYYTRSSGVGLALQNHPLRTEGDGQLRVGAVGMGVGTVAAYAGPGDHYRFYEINRTMETIARGPWFSYLGDAEARGAAIEVVIGDGRTMLEYELATSGSNRYDVLVVDAFSAGSIPMHLLTRGCFALYWQHLQPDGILAVHISNRLLDFRPIMVQEAMVTGKEAVWISATGKGEPASSNSDWVLLSANQTFLALARDDASFHPLPPRAISWTDDFSNLLSVLATESP